MNKFHWKPRDWFDMTAEEKAYVIAAIDKRIENEKKAQRKVGKK